MSLINQVLKDLDERRAAEFSEAKTELDDLHFAHTPPPPNKAKPVIIGSIISVVIIAIALTGFYFYTEFRSQAEPAIATAVGNHAVSQSVPASMADKEATHAAPVVQKPMQQQVSAAKQPVKQKPASHKQESVMQTDTSDAETPVVSEAEEEPFDNSPVKFSRNSVPLRPEQKAERAYQQGYDHLQAHHHRQAEQSLRQALAMQPGHIKARELLAGIYIKQGRWIEASELLRQGLGVSPRHLTFSKLYARSLMQLNQDDQAIAVLTRAAPAIDKDPSYFAILAALYQRQNQHARAAEVYARLVTVNGHNGVWWVGLGISLEALGRQQDAKQAYGHARNTGNLRAEVARFTDNRLLALQELNFPSE